MPKRLYILRHAKAEGAQFAKEDHERCLTERGVNDALRLAEHMRAQGMKPSLAFCSPAERTKETLEQLCATLSFPIEMHKEIYMASVTRLLDVISNAPDSADSLLLIGHNPGVHQLALQLAKKGEADALEELALHYPTCTLSIFTIDTTSWCDIARSPSVLEALITSDSLTHAPVGHAA